MFGKRKRRSGDFFKASVEDRRSTEDAQPWFLGDDDAPDLEVEAGRSAAMQRPEGDQDR